MVSMASFSAVGIQRKSGNAAAAIVTSKLIDDGTDLFKVVFELNPLDSTVDQRIIVRGMPIEVAYDGKTVAELVKCFTIPIDAKLAK